VAKHIGILLTRLHNCHFTNSCELEEMLHYQSMFKIITEYNAYQRNTALIPFYFNKA